ncbi:putative entry exclusion protein TrbK-alt [Stakelama marina]|uniref:Putative entry exclusion protein TrbK-alt n=1 Tax=Stakelama marina TaxID=2826939 RepID=A0A8T4IHM6_9SPHN|nr:putative entry exclusion protein TrbK-alt [Stakelama marina]MBR0553532.1 putative entry exclusion protein TrbK-alt [Stakelama marina]
MDTKLLARIGAAVFVGLAVATTIVQLREEPAPVRQADRRIWVPDGDPLPAQLRVCAEMGELALSSPDCRAAWAEKRRRFFAVDHPEAYSGIDDRALPESFSREARGEN